jgi:prevent-host-death family protein
MKVSISELRKETTKIVKYVEDHHRVVLTKRGKPCAEIVPFQARTKKEKDDAFGMWADHKELKSVEAYFNRIRKGHFEDVD